LQQQGFAWPPEDTPEVDISAIASGGAVEEWSSGGRERGEMILYLDIGRIWWMKK
jgi:hypothetical protein